MVYPDSLKDREQAKFANVNNSPAVRTSAASDEFMVEVEVSGSYTYVGKARPGTTAGQALWQIFRVTTASGTKKYAESSIEFDKTWSSRASYTYG